MEKEEDTIGDDLRMRFNGGPFVTSTLIKPPEAAKPCPLERFVPEGVAWTWKWYEGSVINTCQIYFRTPDNVLLLEESDEYTSCWCEPDWINLDGPKIDDPEKAVAWIKQALVEKFEKDEIMFVTRKS